MSHDCSGGGEGFPIRAAVTISAAVAVCAAVGVSSAAVGSRLTGEVGPCKLTG